MTIKFNAGGRITGLSTDTKPTDLPDHYIFHETDTGDDFTLLSGVWIKKSSLSTLEASSVIVDDALIFPDGSTQSHAFDSSQIGWDVDTRIFKQSFDVTGEDSTPGGLFFKLDGTKMYVIGGDDRVYEYNLSVAWDISTAVIFQNILLTEDTITTDIFFRSDGLKMYITGRATGGFIYEYDLGTAWDVSTVVFLQSFGVSPPELNPLSIDFKPDGKTMYIVGNQTQEVLEFNLTTPWDISTASVGNSVDISTEETNPNALWFKVDGTKMYLGGIDSDTLFQYSLSIPWDITTATVEKSFNPDIVKNTSGIYVRRDGLKLYTISLENDSVHEFDLGLVTEGRMFQFGNKVSSRGTTTSEVFSEEADLPAPVAGAITLPTGFCFFKKSMTLVNRLIIPAGAIVSMIGEDTQNTTITYSGDGTFITVDNSSAFLIRDLNIILNGNNTQFIDITGGDVFLEHANITFSGMGTEKLGTISSTGVLALSSIDFVGSNLGFTITTVQDIRANLLNIVTGGAGTDTLFDVLALTRIASFKNCIFNINTNESIFGFAGTITNPIILRDLLKIGTGSFYETEKLTQADPPVTSTNNVGSPDSITSGDLSFLNIATPQLVTITAQGTPVAIAGGTWTSANRERLNATTDGLATYTGIETQDFKVTFSALIEKLTGGATNIGLTVLINGVDVTTNPPHSVNAGIIQISGTRIFTLSTGDTLQLAVFNDGDTNNIEISQAHMSIST